LLPRQYTLVESNVLTRRGLDTDLGQCSSPPASLKGAFDARQSGDQGAKMNMLVVRPHSIWGCLCIKFAFCISQWVDTLFDSIQARSLLLTGATSWQQGTGNPQTLVQHRGV
jgi:hypothetical protein